MSELMRKCYLRILIIILISGCSALLAKEKNIIVGNWKSYQEAQETFDKIIPHVTTVPDLYQLNLDPNKNNDITLLNYSDIATRFVPSTTVDGYTQDSGVGECIAAKTQCKGYEINEKAIRSKRYGNFFADLLTFNRKTDITGWHFNGIVLIKNDLVIYKLTSGKTAIHEKLEVTKPLGPLQSGGIIIDVIKNNY